MVGEVKYGNYCSMCKVLGIKPTSYKDLTEIEYKNVRETYLTFRKF